MPLVPKISLSSIKHAGPSRISIALFSGVVLVRISRRDELDRQSECQPQQTERPDRSDCRQYDEQAERLRRKDLPNTLPFVCDGEMTLAQVALATRYLFESKASLKCRSGVADGAIRSR